MKQEINLSYVILNLIKSLAISDKEMADLLSISYKQLRDYIVHHDNPRADVSNRIINIIEQHNFDVFKLLDIEDDGQYLFHGSKTGGIKGTISTHASSENVDFGNGFYLSESFKTALSYVISKKTPIIYSFKKDLIMYNSKVFSFYNSQSYDWVLFIGLNRNKITSNDDQMFFRNVYDKQFKDYDILVGEIADSYNFDIMDGFFKNQYDVLQTEQALKLANIGPQYVIKNESLANKLVPVNEYHIELKLKEYLKEYTRTRKSRLKDMYQSFINNKQINDKYSFDNLKNVMREKYERD